MATQRLSKKQAEVIRLMRGKYPRMSYFYYNGNKVHCHLYSKDYGVPSIKAHWGSCKALISKGILEEKKGDFFLTELGKDKLVMKK